MEIFAEITREEHEEFIRGYYLDRNWAQRITIVALIALTLSLLVIIGAQKEWNLLFYAFVFFFAVIGIFVAGLPYLALYYKVKRLLNDLDIETQRLKYGIDTIGLTINDGSRDTIVKWVAIDTVSTAYGCVYFKSIGGGLYLIPLKYFEGGNATQALKAISNCRYNRAPKSPAPAPIPAPAPTPAVTPDSMDADARPQVYPRQVRAAKPNATAAYWIGLVCVIPFLGAIAGLVLLILGITHYKNKILITIAASGMVISVVIGCVIVKRELNKNLFAKAFGGITQSEVNSLAKNIELYKVQNGEYPDSLEQLSQRGDSISIYDPMINTRFNNRTHQFHYEKEGRQYLLFSVGVDGKPFTKDDVYPNLANNGKNKLGFIEKKSSNH